MKNGTELIAAERLRQVTELGMTPAHDTAINATRELASAAQAYVMEYRRGLPRAVSDKPQVPWPWDKAAWKPSADPVETLTMAGALIAAEIDRLQGTGPKVPAKRVRAPAKGKT